MVQGQWLESTVRSDLVKIWRSALLQRSQLYVFNVFLFAYASQSRLASLSTNVLLSSSINSPADRINVTHRVSDCGS